MPITMVNQGTTPAIQMRLGIVGDHALNNILGFGAQCLIFLKTMSTPVIKSPSFLHLITLLHSTLVHPSGNLPLRLLTKVLSNPL